MLAKPGVMATGRAACIGALTAALLGAAAAAPAVPGCGSISVFAADANGDTEPLRVLFGPGNGLGRPAVIAVDRKGHLYVTNAQNRAADDAVRVFAPDADGTTLHYNGAAETPAPMRPPGSPDECPNRTRSNTRHG